MKAIRLYVALATLSISALSYAQQISQNIRGRVVDALTHEPIEAATVQLTDDPSKGCVTDSTGRFSISSIPVGRYSVVCKFIGYDPVEINDVLVTSAKESTVNIEMYESVNTLKGVVVRSSIVKDKTLNRWVTTGGRMFSVEEASRYAGGFDDPARLATAFAGVASGGSTNGISIHGNAPHLLSWRLEDVEVPNPNHFSDISVLGGGVFSSLSAMCIGNSDFLTSAFPAEYGNAVSGVFDMKMRNGNDEHHEHTVQVGVGSIDIASEGPISKKNGSSYIINYRYSMTGLANDLKMIDMQGEVMNYQDLNFKLNLPTRKAGTFSVWGTGLIDKFHNETAPCDWDSRDDERYSYSKQHMGATGLGHILPMPRGQLRTSLGFTFSRDEFGNEMYDLYDGFDFNAKNVDVLENVPRYPSFIGIRTYQNLSFRSVYTHRFTKKWIAQFGASYTHMFFDVNMREAYVPKQPLHYICSADGNTGLVSAFTTNSFNIGGFTTLNLGVNAQHLTLNGATVVEPRAGVTFKTSQVTSLALAYGLHSRAEKTDIYFTRDLPDPNETGDWTTVPTSDKLVNDKLGFTKSHHLMLTFSYKMSDYWNLKIEPYYQKLFNVPVEDGKPYSVLNRQEFYLDKALVNKGEGRNYGVDITLERYLNNGWYGMVNGSFFSSRYKGGDGKWRHTLFDRSYIVNVLGGKEWMLGRSHNNMLSINVKATFQGGDRYSPVDVAKSLAHPNYQVQYDEANSFSLQHDPMLIMHYTVSYRMNRKSVTHEFSIKHINCTGTKSFYGYEYDYRHDKFNEQSFTLSLPLIAYKLEF
ncbi:MAG: carboxypeptidase-like regulatory domain-containing protein [Bacteroidaceae bacterium]|nr:carboxypeptidase-like regulatory domain-containing protein [Bacteroidaceae bacterium]